MFGERASVPVQALSLLEVRKLLRMEAPGLGLRELLMSLGSSYFPPFCQIVWALEAAKGAWPWPSLPLLGASSLPASVLPLATVT